LDWVIEINRGCRQPDLTLFLDVPASVCWERIRTERSHRELFEHSETLESVRHNFHRIIERLRGEGENILKIAGTANGYPRSISEIGREVQTVTKELLWL
jgi:thymidylate kinase